MKIDWEGKTIIIGKGTTTIEAVGNMISIETDGDVSLFTPVATINGEVGDVCIPEQKKEVWSDWLCITNLTRDAFVEHSTSSKIGLAISVLELQGVRQVKIRESNLMRVEIIVRGGDIYKIADIIYNHKPCGVLLVGSVAIDIPTEYECASTIRFNYIH